jgi:hypothetical protein
VEPDSFRENIITTLFRIKTRPLWKGFDQVKSQWIPCNGHHHFLVLNRTLRPFKGFLICLKPDLLMISAKTEPPLVEGDKKMLTSMFDYQELEQQLI